MASQSSIVLKNFKGLNTGDPRLIGDTEFVVCRNVDITDQGRIDKRKGFDLTHTGSPMTGAIRILGLFYTVPEPEEAFFKYIIATDDYDGGLYYSLDGENWTIIPGSAGGYPNAPGTTRYYWGLQYRHRFYMSTGPFIDDDGDSFGGGALVQWDGVGDADTIDGAIGGVAGVVHKDRLFIVDGSYDPVSAEGFGASGGGYRVHFSEPGAEHNGEFLTDAWPEENFIDVNPIDGDFLNGIITVNDLLILFKTKTTWALYVSDSDPFNTWVLRNASPSVGCYGVHTPINVENHIYFTSYDGIYRTDGLSFVKITDKLSEFFVLGDSDTERSLNFTQIRRKEFSVKYEGRIIFGVLIGDTDLKYLVYYYRQDVWTEWKFPDNGIDIDWEEDDLLPYNMYAVINNDFGGGIGIYAGALSDGRVYQYGQPQTTVEDGGDSFEVRLESKYFDLNNPLTVKRCKWGSFDGKFNVGIDDQTLNLGYIVNDSGVAGGGAIASSGVTVRIPGAGYFNTMGYILSYTGTETLTVSELAFVMSNHRAYVRQ